MLPRRRYPLGPRLLGTLAAAWRGGDRAPSPVARFEQAVGKRLGARHVIATTSGREALLLALEACGVQAGDEVVVPGYTLGELIPLLRQRGWVPVPADIDPDSYLVTAASVAARITPRTAALVVVHLFGAPCDTAGIGRVAEARGVPMIEDAAHAFGAVLADGRAAGTAGAAGIFSLEPAKPLGTFGGGLLVTADDAIAERVRRAIGSRPRRELAALRRVAGCCLEEWLVRSPLYGPAARLLFSPRLAATFERLYRGGHARTRSRGAFTRLQAAVGLAALERFDHRQRRLATLVERLAGALPPGWRAQRRDRHGQPACYQLVADYRGAPDTLRQRLLARGIDVAIGSEVMDDIAALLGVGGCPNAAHAAAHNVLLPVHDGLTERRLRHLVAALANSGEPIEQAG